MKKAACLLAAVSILAAPASALAQHHRPIPATADVKQPTKATTVEMSLLVGENKTIPSNDVTSYSVGSTSIVDVKVAPEGKNFVFVGIKPGSTTVLMLKANGTEVTYAVNVYLRDIKQVEAEVRELLSGYPALKTRVIGPRLFIEGGVAAETDVRRIQLIASLYSGQVESLVVVGSVGEEHTTNVRIDFYFVQYDKSSSYGVGLAFPGRIGNGTLNATYDLVNKAGTATLTAAQVLPSLDLAASKGWGEGPQALRRRHDERQRSDVRERRRAQLRGRGRPHRHHPVDQVRHERHRPPPPSTRSRKASK